MGKNKNKTRWRTFSLSKEDEANGVASDIQTQQNPSEPPHKYSQVLGDHQTNFLSPIGFRNSSNHNLRTRNSYNNKENYYNQRSAAKNILSNKLSQRYNNHHNNKYSSTLKDNKKFDSENGSSEINKNGCSITSETLKFNEEEYTRITTPRQDVLFKKGYLSRMNNNTNNIKTVSPPATVSTNGDSTAPNSTIATTNSDQESSVSTLSPAETPPMDIGQQNADGLEYAAPLYYPGYYYDENGIMVIPMYNGYNCYSNGSSTPSPVYLMPYPYQYDPFFMAPNTEVPLVSEKPIINGEQGQLENSTETKFINEKSENTKCPIAEDQNGARMSSDDAISNSSSQREETEVKEKDVKQESTENISNEQSTKQSYSFYPNEYGYVYPAYSNGFYNGVYYYPNGMPSNRPAKLKRRKRFFSSRNSHPSRSTETTTDYSDDEAGNSSYVYKRYNPPRHHNGWGYHHHHQHHYNNNNNYNQYHYNSKYSYRNNAERNTNEKSSNLNVDVPEFYPCSKSENEDEKKPIETPKPDVPVIKSTNASDLQTGSKTVKTELPVKNTTTKPSQVSSKLLNGRVTKKEIIEGIKSMEKQNINLVSTSKSLMVNGSAKVEDEWNVIKNGKKIKVLKEEEMNGTQMNENCENNKDKIAQQVVPLVMQVNTNNSIATNISSSSSKKTVQPQLQIPSKTQTIKSKKSKSKNKKKKNHFLVKQDGFEIIEPDFGNNSDGSSKIQQEIDEATDDDVSAATNSEVLTNECEVLSEEIAVNEEVVAKEVLNSNTQSPSSSTEQDVIIDISDEDICSKSIIEIDPSIAQEIVDEIQKEEESKNVEDASKQQEETADLSFFENHKNFDELERDLMENLKILDDGIDIKSPIINPLFDFPITSAVQKWLQEKQNESFENLFRLENFKKLSELYDDCDDDDDDEDDKSEISDSTDSDYASDIQVKLNESPASSNAKIDTKIATRCNNKIAVKESFCALM